MNSNQDVERAGAFPKKVKVPMKVSAIKKVELPLADDSNRLGEPIVIAITCGNYSQELVIHRPVGHHDLSTEDWVLTPISEVEPLLAMAVDPSKPAKEAALNKMRVDYLVDQGKYVKIDGKLHYPKEIWEGRSLADANAAAKEAWRDARDEAHQQYLGECEAKKTTPKRNWKFGQVENHFLPEEVKTYESKLREELKLDEKFKARVKALGLDSYRTLTGPFQDRPQAAIDTRGQKFTRSQMVDQVKKTLIQAMSPSMMNNHTTLNPLAPPYSSTVEKASVAAAPPLVSVPAPPPVHPAKGGKGTPSPTTPKVAGGE